jgi:sigma-B regulation protein RsbU (phosphoserine phosphatase)
MSDRQPLLTSPEEEIQSLKEQLARQEEELTQLKNQKAASAAQSLLLENLVSMARSPEREEMLKMTLQSTLDISAKLTRADTGSLFLLNTKGKVTDSILTRREAAEAVRQQLIGSVLDKGLAGWVSRNRQIGLITDTEYDDRWIKLPNQPYEVRSALGVPILQGEDLLGILTLLHQAPNHFTEESANLIKVTAEHIALVLETARLYGTLEDYSRALKDELEKGRQIQQDFLPEEVVQLPNWEIDAFFSPAKQVAGDFYDTFVLGDQVCLVIADVCDKGVGAALFMALFRSLLRIFSSQKTMRGETSNLLAQNRPSQGWLSQSNTININHLNALHAVELTNNYVAENHWRLCMFATTFFGILDPESGVMTYINGGHEDLFLVNQQGIKATLPSTGPAVGMMADMEFKVEQIQFEAGDILLGYTDGVPDADNPDGEKFTKERLLPLVEEPALSASALLERIKTKLFEHIDDAAQFDDITMLVVQRL